MRQALVGATLGGALALGGTLSTAQAAEPAQPAPKVSAKASAGEKNVGIMSWRFYAAYWTNSACVAVGEQSGRDYYCQYKRGNDGRMKYFLYLWY
ncbi:hypothetical protein ACIBKX_18220 [Streptomyces sp. NPDC050658]|uniref:hypothetical protein n=1 Tax=unclassified Streptomyces TaxID=2593676 RepID=UPI00342679A4